MRTHFFLQMLCALLISLLRYVLVAIAIICFRDHCVFIAQHQMLQQLQTRFRGHAIILRNSYSYLHTSALWSRDRGQAPMFYREAHLSKVSRPPKAVDVRMFGYYSCAYFQCSKHSRYGTSTAKTCHQYCCRSQRNSSAGCDLAVFPLLAFLRHVLEVLTSLLYDQPCSLCLPMCKIL